MDSEKSRVDGRNIKAKDYPSSEGASALPPPVYINKCDTAIFIAGKCDADDKVTRNDALVTITRDVLTESKQKEVPMYSLEQEVCEKLRETKNSTSPHFKELCGLTFRQFLERNYTNFNVKKIGNSFMVSKNEKKKKKRKKKENENLKSAREETTVSEIETISCDAALDTYEPVKSNVTSFEMDMVNQQPVDVSTTEWSGARPKESETRKRITESNFSFAKNPPPLQINDGKNVLDKTIKGQARFNIDESLISSLLMKPQDKLLLFRKTETIYTNDPIQFTLDVVSMWNTPYCMRAHIILGVKTKATPPHVIMGLTTNSDDDFYQSLLQKYMFDPNFLPKFSYREANCHGKNVGIIQIESSRATGFPCLVINDNMAPRLQKGQLWTRKGVDNICVLPTDLLMGQIHIWFGSHQKSIDSQQHMSTATSSSSSSSSYFLSDSSQETEKETENVVADSPTPSKKSPAKRLMDALSYFQKGHFVLMCGSTSTLCKNLEALASVPWIVVYDFDCNGRDSGLLARLEDSIKDRRSLTVSTWCDPVKGITEKGTQWWSLRGRRDIPESFICKDSNKTWVQRVHKSLDKLCQELARFSEDYTVLTILVLWPNSNLETECMQRFLSKLQESMEPKVAICFTDTEHSQADSMDVQMIVRSFSDSVELFHVCLGDLCTEIELIHRCSQHVNFTYQLPSSSKSKPALITEEDASWLTQDLEILYLNSPFAKSTLTTIELKEEADKFYRGGTIGWYAWYALGPGFFDVERSISKDITGHIRNIYLDKCRSGMVTVFHAPGSGGSTMAQRVLWDLHASVPCVQVKQRSGNPVEEVAARLTFLYEKTHQPVVALLDGEDEPRLKQLLMHVQRSYVVIVYVKRFPYRIDPTRLLEQSESRFYLRGVVTKEESQKLFLRLSERCPTDEKIKALNRLDEDVQKNGVDHHMYEYGMTVYDHEFKGVRAFVKGYLQLEQNRRGDLQTWQKCLGILSLVYYYGQSAMPCHFFASLLGMPPNYKVDLKDLPFSVAIFVVPDSNEGRSDYIRIGHYIIAKEILEQILNRSNMRSVCKGNRDTLSEEARRNLKEFCMEVISYAAKKRNRTSVTSQTITTILARTFIFRDNKEVIDMNQTKRQFSRIMADIDSKPPYNGRLEVLQKLCDTFPDDPNFRAHLGRFYACCRPEEEQEAENHFEKALRLCGELSEGREPQAIDDGLKFTLMHVYHMYGTLFQRRISKQRGKGASERFGEKTEERFQQELDEIVRDAERACMYFIQSRYYTPPGHAGVFTFINEIIVRLHVCEFVKRYFEGGIQEFLSQRRSNVNYLFIKNSITEIDDLIKECYSVVLLDINDHSLQKALQWFNDIFQSCVSQLEILGKSDDLMSRRQLIMAKKLEFPRSENIFSVESSVPTEKIESFVSLLESLFQQENVFRDSVKGKLELDYKDWLTAIRNRGFTKVYSLEKVLEHVRHWHDSVRSPMSTFYVFVLLSLLGFGSDSQTGNTESLVEAQTMRDDLQKFSKMEIRPRFPREWLGRDDLPGILRMVSSTSVGYVEDRSIKGSRTKLSVCKGTIRAKNKRLSGNIDLDLGENRTPVHVFFVPLFAGLEGARYSGKRVQFHVAFNLEHGYEAYEVKVLDKHKCNKCYLKIEMKQDESEVVCVGCGGVVVRNEHTQVRLTTPPPSDED